MTVKAKNIKRKTRPMYDPELLELEKEHLLLQAKAWPHTHVHWKMLRLALRYRVWKEVLRQIPRLFLAAPGSILGKAPKGNVGSTKMGIFEKR